MSEYKIAVVNSSSFGQIFKEHWSELEKIGQVDRFMFAPDISGKELAEKLQGYNIVIASVTPNFTKEFFGNITGLELISRHGIGFNSVDIAAAKEHGVKVTIVPPLVERDAVAENAVANLFAIARQTCAAANREAAGHYEDRAHFMGHQFNGKQYGVIGCGNIGSRVAEIFHLVSGGKDVLIADPHSRAREGWWEQNPWAKLVSLDELLANCDYISLNASLDEKDYHMLNAEALKKTKQGVYFTNCARGALIDEKAMMDAVKSGQVAGYASDTMEVEPVPGDHPFLHDEHFLITPHTSAYTYECLYGMGEKCVSDVKNLVAGKPLVRELTSELD